MTKRARIQLGPETGTAQWIRGSIDAWVLMRTYGMEVPHDWSYPEGIEYLSKGMGWPDRAVWYA